MSNRPKTFLGRYLFNILLAFDQVANVILLGDPDDTISGRCGRALTSGNPKWFVKPLARHIDWVFLKLVKQQNHCIESMEPEDQMTYELWKWHG